MKTINEFYEEKHKQKQIKIEPTRTLNDLFDDSTKEKETQQKKTVTSEKKIVFTKKKTIKKGFRYELEYFISSFSNTEKSISVTLFIMFCLVISLLVVQLHNREKEVLIEMSLDPEELADLEIPKPQETEDITELQNNSKMTISAYNESDMDLQHSQDALKTLDEIMAEREMKEANNELITSNSVKNDFVLPTDMGLDKETKLPENKSVVNKNALVKYALTDRTLRTELPNPIFTCERYGKIIVVIKVDEGGNVIDATIDKINSTSSDGCLIENALAYAQQAQFNTAIGRGIQIGTITYSFQQK